LTKLLTCEKIVIKHRAIELFFLQSALYTLLHSFVTSFLYDGYWGHPRKTTEKSPDLKSLCSDSLVIISGLQTYMGHELIYNKFVHLSAHAKVYISISISIYMHARMTASKINTQINICLMTESSRNWNFTLWTDWNLWLFFKKSIKVSLLPHELVRLDICKLRRF
jgi:hypothetical protein